MGRIEERVEELPGRRKRAAPRCRKIAMLVVVSRGEVLLEKRPPTGIWGRLWSLPDAEATESPAAALARDWGLEATQAEALATFKHAFTHFTLEVAPWRLHIRNASRLAADKPAVWLPLSEIAHAALPSPVRKLLEKVA